MPATARTWFSNWLVSAPSIVQWPELWTRGAISLARSAPLHLEELERQHADVAELLEERARELLGLRACSAGVTAGAGASDRRRMPPSWRFSTSG